MICIRMQYFDKLLLTWLCATNSQLSYILNAHRANMDLEENISSNLNFLIHTWWGERDASIILCSNKIIIIMLTIVILHTTYCKIEHFINQHHCHCCCCCYYFYYYYSGYYYYYYKKSYSYGQFSVYGFQSVRVLSQATAVLYDGRSVGG